MAEKRTESQVRDHLANERTYLAWLRTGIALLGLGFIVAKLGADLPSAGFPSNQALIRSSGVAILFAIAGLLVVAFGTWRFFETERMILREDFRPLGYRALGVSLAMLVIGLAVLVYLWNKM